jgi:quinoprotein glucose dehydrogenase
LIYLWPVRDLFNLDPHLWVYEKVSGEMLAEMELPANATGAPITYMASGKQFIAFPSAAAAWSRS